MIKWMAYRAKGMHSNGVDYVDVMTSLISAPFGRTEIIWPTHLRRRV